MPLLKVVSVCVCGGTPFHWTRLERKALSFDLVCFRAVQTQSARLFITINNDLESVDSCECPANSPFLKQETGTGLIKKTGAAFLICITQPFYNQLTQLLPKHSNCLIVWWVQYSITEQRYGVVSTVYIQNQYTNYFENNYTCQTINLFSRLIW